MSRVVYTKFELEQKVCSGAYFQICTMKGAMPIAIYHFHVKMVSRVKGKSAVGKAAYISGEKIKNEYDSVVHDYRKKKEIVHKEILLPDNAPSKFKKRSVLWNAVEKSETRKNSQTARDIDAALPVELSREEQIDLVRNFCNQCFVSSGMCVDFAIHDKNDGNPHVHILLTTRHVDSNGFTAKDRSWNDKDLLKLWRERWADWCNHKLYSVSDESIDHRSYAEQGIDKVPQLHLGTAACAIEKKGVKTDKGSRNRRIQLINVEAEISALTEKKSSLLNDINENSKEYIGVKLGCDFMQSRMLTEYNFFLKALKNILDREGFVNAVQQCHPQSNMFIRPQDEQTVLDIANTLKQIKKQLQYDYGENISAEMLTAEYERQQLSAEKEKQADIAPVQEENKPVKKNRSR